MNGSILITGAGGNLGSAVLKKFRDFDFQVAAIVSDKRKSKLEETERLKIYPLDLLDENKVERTVKLIVENSGEINMAVLTVGGFAMGGIIDTGSEDLERMYRLNFLTAYHMARQVFQQMLEQEEGGQIILIGSRPAIHPGQAKEMISYAFSKSLLFRLAEVINQEGAGSGITATVIVPGTIDTPQNREAMPGADFSSWVTPVEIADNIFHLLTPAGKQLRESIIKVYGRSQV